jgi:hypothetical protein
VTFVDFFVVDAEPRGLAVDVEPIVAPVTDVTDGHLNR